MIDEDKKHSCPGCDERFTVREFLQGGGTVPVPCELHPTHEEIEKKAPDGMFRIGLCGGCVDRYCKGEALTGKLWQKWAGMDTLSFAEFVLDIVTDPESEDLTEEFNKLKEEKGG